MPFDILNLLQRLLLPLTLGAVVVVGLLLWLRRRAVTADRPVATPATTPATIPATTQAPQRAAQPAPMLQRVLFPAAQPAGARAPAPVPTATPTATTAAPAGKAPPPPLRADLLLVDDSAVVRAKLRRLFEPAGYRIALAQDGEAALALLQAGRYGLLITDLEMPRLDGLGLVRATQALPDCAGMPILAITGHDGLQSQLHQCCAVAGIHRKPWVDADLLGQVQALVQPSLQLAEAAALEA
ncbi:MAG: response regulator [Pseudomonadota bacterium]